MIALLGVVLLVLFFGLGAFSWAWWHLPKNRVPPHLTSEELKLLETEDRLRQTNYQLLAGGALAVTFILALVQALTSYNQWIDDHLVRSRQAEITHLSEALKALSSQNTAAAQIAGFYSLRQLVASNPDEGELASAVLVETVRGLAKKPPEGWESASKECSPGDGNVKPLDRVEPIPQVQFATRILGEEVFMKLRNAQAQAQAWECVPLVKGKPMHHTNLSHLPLDNLDLSDTRFPCVDFSQSHFRRTSFRAAKLQGADFRGSSFDDWRNAGFDVAIRDGVARNKSSDGGTWLHGHEPDWRRYRCWVADLRWADLSDAHFDGAGLAGADFTEATLARATFNNANVSRANFTRTAIKPEQLANACADDQPVGLNFEVKPCQ